MRRRARSPLAALDRAIELARAQAWGELLTCAAPALGMTWLCLIIYQLEWVEGVHGLRAVFALGFALAYCTRAWLLSRFAGRLVDRLLMSAGAARRHGPAHVPLRIAVLIGAELWLWSWLLVLALRIDLWLLPLALPLLALRALIIPSWLAACDGAPDPRVLPALGHAARAAHGRRGSAVAAELFLFVAAVVIALNLGALAATVISLSQDLFGLELAFVRAFVSPRNHFVLLLLAGISLSALEPLRAALSAVLYADYRLAEEAIELRALVARCVARGPKPSVAVLALFGALLTVGAAAAQHVPDSSWPPEHAQPFAEECDDACREARARDDATLVALVSILERPEFHDFPDRRLDASGLPQVSLESVIARFVAWLRGDAPAGTAVRPAPTASAAQLRLGMLLAALFVLGFGVLAYRVLRTRRPQAARSGSRQRQPAGSGQGAPSAATPAPAQHDASAELRALYLAGLSALAQRGLLSLTSSATNGHYLRALPLARERALLSELTQLFERTHYGALSPDPGELARARELAAHLRMEAGR